ncbi:MAG TPA: hypothetical protein VF142_16530 [Longimicrobium sp.]
MVPDHASGFLRLRRRAQHMPAAAAVALFVSTAVLWLVTVQPASSISSWRLGSGTPFTVERAVVLLTSAAGAFAILAGLFAISVYALNWPVIQHRENVRMLAQARAELADLRRRVARVSAQMAALRALRAQIAMYEAQLARARAASHLHPGRASGNGLELVDDIISELQAVGDGGAGNRVPW